MSRTEIIEKTILTLNRLPESAGEEVADFADFMLKKWMKRIYSPVSIR